MSAAPDPIVPAREPHRHRAALRFVLTGTYCSANKGDAAMELAALAGLVTRFPESRTVLLSPFPDLDRPFYRPTRVEVTGRRRLISTTLDLLRGLLWRATGGARSAGRRWLLGSEMRLVRDADLVVDLSGDMLTEDYGPHVAYSHFVPILRALIAGRPYFLCAQSIGPFRLTLPLARLLLRRAAAITVRDEISLEYLRALNLAPGRIEQTADLAFLLEPSRAERADEILRAEGIVRDGRPLLGLSVSQLVAEKFHTRNPAAARGDFASLVRRVIQQIVAVHGVRVILVSHVTGPTPAKDDRVLATRVAAELGSPDVSALRGDYRPEELKAIIARCHLFCGARMHANIAALSSGVPVVAISYSHKTPGIMAMCGLGDFVASIESVSEESLVALLDRASRERTDLAARLLDRLAAIRTAAERNFEVIEALLFPSRAVA